MLMSYLSSLATVLCVGVLVMLIYCNEKTNKQTYSFKAISMYSNSVHKMHKQQNVLTYLENILKRENYL